MDQDVTTRLIESRVNELTPVVDGGTLEPIDSDVQNGYEKPGTYSANYNAKINNQAIQSRADKQFFDKDQLLKNQQIQKMQDTSNQLQSIGQKSAMQTDLDYKRLQARMQRANDEAAARANVISSIMGFGGAAVGKGAG